MLKRYRSNDDLSKEEQCPIKIPKLEINQNINFQYKSEENLVTHFNVKVKHEIKQEFENGFSPEEQKALEIILNLPIESKSDTISELNEENCYKSFEAFTIEELEKIKFNIKKEIKKRNSILNQDIRSKC